MSKKSATFNQVDNSKSEAGSDHTKHLMDPQLREGESCEHDILKLIQNLHCLFVVIDEND